MKDFGESIINCFKSKGGKLACDFVIEEGVHRGIQSVKAGVVEENVVPSAVFGMAMNSEQVQALFFRARINDIAVSKMEVKV